MLGENNEGFSAGTILLNYRRWADVDTPCSVGQLFGTAVKKVCSCFFTEGVPHPENTLPYSTTGKLAIFGFTPNHDLSHPYWAKSILPTLYRRADKKS